MKTKHLISISDLEISDIIDIFKTTYKIKKLQKQGKKYTPLSLKTLAMIFAKPSTRTRVSFETGMFQLGGLAIFLRGKELQMGRGETIADTARILSRYVHGIMIRTFDHKDVIEFAKYSTVPVINGLTDLEHPCQILGDVYTIIEKKLEIKNGKFRIEYLKNLKIVFVGDGNNIVNSLMLLCAKLGINLTVITPKGYEPDKNIYNNASNIAKKTGALISLSNKIEDIKNADIAYTDVWISMGQEAEREKRLNDFAGFQINRDLLSKAKSDCMVMHCLPAHRGEEITNDIIEGKNSIVFEQAENRLHIQKAIMLLLMK
ncbi:MAG: ornithine carbamoyltransferase [Elusimicrobia bacterium RIFOXYC2_FULL_34_12]|nr:MAG: ornithine carbamoyltransferase [Elusimicrobia bacterium RIFOXYC2_FULL_34_12]OGS38152.1 MAG: ornithine carbamoyltransferase [Elusimicrobia bacterium RIFOXYD2_FULL_34_30]HAM38216.1 ornithine carbamoyltransferase [Elusimicrobiota bacterium]